MTELVRTRLASGLSAHVCEPAGPGRRRLPVLLLHGMMGGAWQFEWFQPALAAAGYRSMAIGRDFDRVATDQLEFLARHLCRRETA